MMVRLLQVLLAVFLMSALLPAATVTVDFDDPAAPCCFGLVTPGGPLGPSLTYPALQLDGGVILNGNTGWGGLQTSDSNVYGTIDFLALQDASLLSGRITGVFSAPMDELGFDVINGFVASTFHVRVYDAADQLFGSASFGLSAYPGVGAVGSVYFNLPGSIKWFEVYSDQATGSKDFAIDTLTYSGAAIPEPSTFSLLGVGVLALVARRRFRR